MSKNPARFSHEERGGSVGWLTLLLLLAVLAPSVCLVWFMNQAVQNERLGVRQKLMEAYRGHLTLAQERLSAYWRQAAAGMEKAAAGLPPPALFAKAVQTGMADALVCLETNGRVAYPGVYLTSEPEKTGMPWLQAQRLEIEDPAAAAAAFDRLAVQTTNASLAAQAFQAEVRCLMKAGKKEEAFGLIEGPMQEQKFSRAADEQGGLIVLNCDLLVLESGKDSPRHGSSELLEHCRKALVNYDDPALSAPQRRFLMHELQRLYPGRLVFPTLAAEDLAARYVESEPTRPAATGLRATSLPGIWQAGPDHGGVISLHRTEGLRTRLNAAIATQILPADIRLGFLAPGQEAENYLLSVAAGPDMPGWRMALSLNGTDLFEQAADQRILTYVWIGILVLVVVAALALLALRLIRKQSELTELKNDLVANVTHELKTPLSSMRLLVDTLIGTDPLNEATTREYLGMIARENLRLSRLIDNFLTFSRIERNKYSFNFRKAPVKTIIDAAAAAAQERFNTPDCQFEITVAPGLPEVRVDADAMTVAVLNLLDNAYKYSGSEKKITLSAGSVNGSVFVAVRDNGIGFTPGETRRIFRRFYQVDMRLSRSRGGCGLGLSIVKFIVNAHGGKVRVESEPGLGSTFTVSLPAVTSTRGEVSFS